jgi:hypothetical protein
MTIFEHPALHVKYDEKMNTIFEEWQLDFTTPLTSKELRDVCNKILDTLKNYQVKKWYCDLSEQKTIDVEDQFWQEEFFYPEMIRHGLKVACLVDTKNILGTVYTKNCLQNIEEQKVQIEVFNHQKEAKQWLSEVKE